MSSELPVVWLARHGETGWSLAEQHTGFTNLPLTQHGERTARRLGKRLRELSIGKVFTSPQQRAADVFRPIVDRTNGAGRWVLIEVSPRIASKSVTLKQGKGHGMAQKKTKPALRVLAVDIGGTNVKILATGQSERRKFPSGKEMTPQKMVKGVKELARDWEYDVVAIGFPGRVAEGRPISEPGNLAPGWVGFDFAAAFERPVKIINDAAMQALGSYNGGTMLFFGLGTGLGSTLIVRGHIVPMELGHLAYKNGTIEDRLGVRGLQKHGKKRWRQTLELLVARFVDGLMLDDFVIGGGNAKKLKKAPPGARLGSNDNAFIGGFRLWSEEHSGTRAPDPEPSS